MIKKDSIAAIVLTHNRLELLKKVVNSLRNQTKKIDQIIVVNNDSTDGTADWLAEQSDLFVITQANTGSSGGQNAGFHAAFEQGYEWIWEMDDDLAPRPDCMHHLFENRHEKQVFSPLRYSYEGDIFYGDTVAFNLTNPFKGFWAKITSPEDMHLDYIPAVGLTFEGAFFHRSLIETIGYTELNIFIYGDDSDFFIRADKVGYKVGVLTKAEADRLLPYKIEEQIHTPKRYYIVRNQIVLDRLHGNWPVRNIRPFIYLVKWLFRSNSWQDIRITFKAFKDGWTYKPVYG